MATVKAIVKDGSYEPIRDINIPAGKVLNFEAVAKTSAGVGAKNGSTVSAVEYGDGVLHKTVLTLTELVSTVA